MADELGVSENRLCAELIHDGLLMREQMFYMEHLRQLANTVSKEDALSILDRVPATPPAREDALDASSHHRTAGYSSQRIVNCSINCSGA